MEHSDFTESWLEASCGWLMASPVLRELFDKAEFLEADPASKVE